jgi:predicted nucleotidyltransferase
MRLTENQRESIKSVVISVIGKESRIWLFGSRVDDSKRGGDIDLLVETETVVPGRVGALAVRLGNRKIDVLLKDASTADAPIYHAARQTGVLL